jgi:SAM-dependent methyltransferase
VLTRWLAQQRGGTQRITGVDVNAYMLREARMMARHAGLEDLVAFQEGSAEDLPLPDRGFDLTMSCTMLEEVDATRALAELVRVIKPGGRVGIIVRAEDMPWWINLPLNPRLKAIVETPRHLGSGVQPQGCADASLYRRLKEARLTEVGMFPQWAIYTEGPFMQMMRAKLLSNLNPEDMQTCRDAVAQADAAETFLIAEPFHCAVGTKP